MIVVAVATLHIFFTGYTSARCEGGVFLGYYVAYSVFRVMQSAEHHLLHDLGAAMTWFVLPLTALTLLAGVITTRISRGERTPWKAGIVSEEARPVVACLPHG